jgi:hypothetical protein
VSQVSVSEILSRFSAISTVCKAENFAPRLFRARIRQLGCRSGAASRRGGSGSLPEGRTFLKLGHGVLGSGTAIKNASTNLDFQKENSTFSRKAS